jgi:hypothetical protein
MANPIESTPKIRKQNTKKINKIGLGGGGSKLGHTSKNKV